MPTSPSTSPCSVTHPILAADVGGTNLKLGVVHNGVVLARASIPAHADRTLAERLPVIASEWTALCAQVGISTRDCGGIGISYPSVMHPQTGRIMVHYNKFAADALDIDLRAWAKDSFGLSLAIENDARTALIGEWQHGIGKGHDNLAMITLGTGIGTAAIINGRPLRGVHGEAVIMGGHTTINHDGAICTICGNIGCAELEASSASLPRIARAMEGYPESLLALEAKTDYEAVFRLAGEGDAVSCRLRDHTLRVWGAYAANLVLMLDPSMLIIGGGIAANPEVVAAIRAHIHHYAMTVWGKVPVEASRLGNDAALLGCEWLGRNS